MLNSFGLLKMEFPTSQSQSVETRRARAVSEGHSRSSEDSLDSYQLEANRRSEFVKLFRRLSEDIRSLPKIVENFSQRFARHRSRIISITLANSPSKTSHLTCAASSCVQNLAPIIGMMSFTLFICDGRGLLRRQLKNTTKDWVRLHKKTNHFTVTESTVNVFFLPNWNKCSTYKR